MTAVLSALMLSDLSVARDASNRYNAAQPVIGTGDGIKALVHAAFGDFEEARVALEAHARIAVTGRHLGQATDSLLALAVLIDGEGDTARSRDMIVNMGRCRHSSLAAYARHVAERLEVGNESQATHDMFFTNTGLDIIKQRAGADVETLRGEMTLRGWK